MSKHHICIRDIKLDNILLDDNYNPVLCDFGYGVISEDVVTGRVGTKEYMAPEVNSSTPYNGFRVDIFNLGIALLILITGKLELCISKKDRKARDLFKGNYDSFWSQFVEVKEKLSKEFKALFINMTLEDPSKRITINKILEDKWFEGLKEKIKELEDNLKKEFDERKEKVLNGLITEKEFENYQMSSLLDYNRGGNDECPEYFKRQLPIKLIDKESIRENYVEIKGKLDPYYFMDKLYNEIKENFKDNYECVIKEKDNQKSLKFNIILEDDANLNDDENEEKDDDEDYDDENNILENNLNIEVKMFRTIDKYLIRFKKKYGDLYDFYENVKKIISAIDNI